ncbi:MAG: Preprotein translocase subunit SecE [candidate division TM6 bacterium GW2011_GWE2_42_60]|nr:MAG: Preprotein translocase subunit SecE [candidate division TM6 bacterium GW2011_GWE2_42_60]
MSNVGRFFGEVQTELKRVEWPKWNEFVGATVVVLFLIVFFAALLWVVDQGITIGIKYIFRLFFPGF